MPKTSACRAGAAQRCQRTVSHVRTEFLDGETFIVLNQRNPAMRKAMAAIEAAGGIVDVRAKMGDVGKHEVAVWPQGIALPKNEPSGKIISSDIIWDIVKHKGIVAGLNPNDYALKDADASSSEEEEDDEEEGSGEESDSDGSEVSTVASPAPAAAAAAAAVVAPPSAGGSVAVLDVHGRPAAQPPVVARAVVRRRQPYTSQDVTLMLRWMRLCMASENAKLKPQGFAPWHAARACGLFTTRTPHSLQSKWRSQFGTNMEGWLASETAQALPGGVHKDTVEFLRCFAHGMEEEALQAGYEAFCAGEPQWQGVMNRANAVLQMQKGGEGGDGSPARGIKRGRSSASSLLKRAQELPRATPVRGGKAVGRAAKPAPGSASPGAEADEETPDESESSEEEESAPSPAKTRTARARGVASGAGGGARAAPTRGKRARRGASDVELLADEMAVGEDMAAAVLQAAGGYLDGAREALRAMTKTLTRFS